MLRVCRFFEKIPFLGKIPLFDKNFKIESPFVKASLISLLDSKETLPNWTNRNTRWINILVLLLNFYLNTTQSRRKRETEIVVFDDISLNNKPQLQFTCEYPRDIDVDSELTMTSTSAQSEDSVTNSGILQYQATVNDVEIGRDDFTEVLIEPKHHLSNIYVM